MTEHATEHDAGHGRKYTGDVNVGLLGFSGDGAWQFELNAGELHSLLSRLLPERQPSCGPEATPMDVTYRLNYNVVLMQTGLARLQRTLATSMRPHAPNVYDVEASDIEEHFDILYSSYFGATHASQLLNLRYVLTLILNARHVCLGI